jgi:NADPH:quinone reductase-like Zn-dependent oxidoreductase
MKAAYFTQFGGPEVLQYGDVADPVAKSGQIVVDIHAASINAADWKLRLGQYASVTQFPYVPGAIFPESSPRLGQGVTDFAIGDAVFGVCDVGRRRSVRRENRNRIGDRRAQAWQPVAHGMRGARVDWPSPRSFRSRTRCT